jgi:O-antigen/teichoic acid export membrane protein
MVQEVYERRTVFSELQVALKHTAVYGLGSIVIKALGFLMLPFYTHFLSPTDYGLLEILDLSMSLLGMVLHLGIAPALLRSYAGAKTGAEKRETASTALLFVSATGVFVFVAVVGLIGPGSAALLGKHVSSKYLFLSFTAFVVSYLGSVPRAFLRALEASGIFTLLETGGLFAMLVLNVYFIAVLKLGAMGILWSSLVVNVVLTAGLIFWMVRRVGLGFSGEKMRQMAAFGMPLILSNMALFALNFSDRFFLQRFQSLEAVGIYAVGYKLAFMINYLLVQPFAAMWQARMYAIFAQEEHPQIFRQIFVLYSVLLTFVALALAVFSPEIMSVMADQKFGAGREIVPVIALAYVFCGLGYYVQLGMFLAEKTSAVGVVGAVAAVVNLGLNYVLIRRYGMMGAALATLAGFAVITVGNYWFSQRTLPLNLGAPRVAAALLIAVVLYSVGVRANVLPAGVAICAKVGVVAGYLLLLWKLRILSNAELSTLSVGRDKMVSVVNRRLAWVAGR